MNWTINAAVPGCGRRRNRPSGFPGRNGVLLRGWQDLEQHGVGDVETRGRVGDAGAEHSAPLRARRRRGRGAGILS